MSRTNSISAISAINTFLDTLRDLGYTPEEVKKALVYFAGPSPFHPLVEVLEPHPSQSYHPDVLKWHTLGGQCYACSGPCRLHKRAMEALAAAPVRGLPLTDAKIDDICIESGILDCLRDPYDMHKTGDEYGSIPDDVRRIVRLAEAAHGIGTTAPGGEEPK